MAATPASVSGSGGLRKGGGTGGVGTQGQHGHGHGHGHGPGRPGSIRLLQSSQPEILENKLYIGNLDPRVNEYALIQLLKPHGTIVREEFLWHKAGPNRGEPRGYCFVEFSTRQEAEKVQSLLHGSKVLYNRPLVVRFAEGQKIPEKNTRILPAPPPPPAPAPTPSSTSQSQASEATSPPGSPSTTTVVPVTTMSSTRNASSSNTTTAASNEAYELKRKIDALKYKLKALEHDSSTSTSRGSTSSSSSSSSGYTHLLQQSRQQHQQPRRGGGSGTGGPVRHQPTHSQRYDPTRGSRGR